MITADLLPAGAWNVERLRGHIGRASAANDRVTAQVADRLRDVTDAMPTLSDLAPLGIQWCLAPPDVPLSGLQEDGHPQSEYTILPPLPAARRMWAGGEIVWHDALRIGDEVTRRSVVADVSMKEGASGALCFVTVRHDYATGRGPAITERQDIVYKRADAGSAGAVPRQPSPPGDLLRRLTTDPVRLFRYSALTGNAHRIHYDRPYATEVEGYPGLVVHGPLQATMLMQAAATLAGRAPSRFTYRAVSPLFSSDELALFRAGSSLWIAETSGQVGMRADVAWEPA